MVYRNHEYSEIATNFGISADGSDNQVQINDDFSYKVFFICQKKCVLAYPLQLQ